MFLRYYAYSLPFLFPIYPNIILIFKSLLYLPICWSSQLYTHRTVKGEGVCSEVDKVTLKSNDDEALNDEFIFKSNGNEALNDVFTTKSNSDEAFNAQKKLYRWSV